MLIGVIGAGLAGKLRICTVLEHPETELAAVVDVSRDAAESAVAGTRARAFTDLRDLSDIDMHVLEDMVTL